MSSLVMAIAYEKNGIYALADCPVVSKSLLPPPLPKLTRLAVGVCCFCSSCRPPLRLGFATTTEVSIAKARRRRLTCKAHIALRATFCYAWPLMSKLGPSLTTSLPSLHVLLPCTFSICCYTLLQVRLIQFDAMLLRQL
uniref:Uncharacterized protein n=1 Tax=Triticum urartu TaxID=4572 RepID=A0A8R7R2B7_TRIUA